MKPQRTAVILGKQAAEFGRRRQHPRDRLIPKARTTRPHGPVPVLPSIVAATRRTVLRIVQVKAPTRKAFLETLDRLHRPWAFTSDNGAARYARRVNQLLQS